MAKKKTTRSRPVARGATARGAAPARRPPARKPAPRVRPAPKAAGAPAAAGTVGIPGREMGEIQDTVRGVVGYVQQNPLAAAAVAIGVGVMLTSMYWDDPGRAQRRTAQR